jgi:DNA-binding transcriptional ArsR family regulator
MVERDPDSLSAILKAAADPTRRAILTLVAQHGDQRVTDLARHFELSLNAVSKHIKVLEAAGLVTRRTDWRDHRIALAPETLGEIDRWFRDLRSIWAIRLEALEAALRETPGTGAGDEVPSPAKAADPGPLFETHPQPGDPDDRRDP